MAYHSVCVLQVDPTPRVKMADRCKMDLSPLSDAVKAIALKELRETPELAQESLAKLRELIKGELSRSQRKARCRMPTACTKMSV